MINTIGWGISLVMWAISLFAWVRTLRRLRLVEEDNEWQDHYISSLKKANKKFTEEVAEKTDQIAKLKGQITMLIVEKEKLQAQLSEAVVFRPSIRRKKDPT